MQRIARSLGLSVTTVSRALGGFSDVANATRCRVAAEAVRIGYQPNATARRLRSGRSEAVGLVLPASPGQFDDPFFMRLLTGLSLHLSRLDLDLLVTAARPGVEEMRAYRRMVEARRVDGFIIARMRRQDPRLRYLLDQNFPFVAHGRSDEKRPYSFLDIDGTAAFAAATRRLIGFGHQRIAMVNATASFMFAGARAAGWRAGLAEAGLAEGPYVPADATEEGGFTAMQGLLALPEPPTAVLCATDRQAAGVLNAISFAGLHAGRDISVIGFDNLPSSGCTDPPLTTMDQMVDDAAERLVEMLVSRLADPAAPPLVELWQARLVPRQSDGPAPKPAPSRARDALQSTSGGRHEQGIALD